MKVNQTQIKRVHQETWLLGRANDICVVLCLALFLICLAPPVQARIDQGTNDKTFNGMKTLSSPTGMVQRLVQLGPVRIFNRSPPAFRWQASVNRTTALAFAEETSKVPTVAPLHNLIQKSKTEYLLFLSKRLFGHYAFWLCRGRVTFGILEAVTRKDRSVEVRERFFGTNLLRFGQPEGHRFTERISNPNISKEHQTQTQCIWAFPILYGFMTASPPSTEVNKREKAKKRGKIVFVLTKTEVSPKSSNGEGGQPDQVSCSLRTELVDYRPFVVGNAPASQLRSCLYLGSQSLVHAIVMWRFHSFCRSITETKLAQLR